jgi:TniQ
MLFSEVDQPWSIHPQPCEGELLESWLARLSQAHFVPLPRFIRSLDLRPFLEGQINGVEAALHHLAQGSRVAVDRILKMHLVSFAEKTQLAYGFQYKIPMRARDESLHYFKICPHCLANQDQAYIRIAWALDITCFCPIHRSILRTTCSDCGACFSWHLDKPHDLLLSCRKCGADISAMTSNPVPAQTTCIEFQQHLLGLHQDAGVQVPGTLQLSGIALVQIIQRLFQDLSRTPSQYLLSGFADASFQYSVHLLDDRFSFHFRRVNAVSIIAWLVEAFSSRAVTLCSHLRMQPLPGVLVSEHARMDQAISRALASFRASKLFSERIAT